LHRFREPIFGLVGEFEKGSGDLGKVDTIDKGKGRDPGERPKRGRRSSPTRGSSVGERDSKHSSEKPSSGILRKTNREEMEETRVIQMGKMMRCSSQEPKVEMCKEVTETQRSPHSPGFHVGGYSPH
jgi:hypothetical protein